MTRLRVLSTLVALVCLAPAIQAQPVDPYAPAPPAGASPAPATPAPVGPAAPAPKTPVPAGPPVAPAAPAPKTPVPAGPATPATSDPQDPYAQPGPPSPQDPALGERVAGALVTRAQELLDAKVFLDAKQLAVEALVRSPRGAAADHARAIIHAVNRQLGIPEDAPKPKPEPPPVAPPPPPSKPAPAEEVDTAPIQDPAVSAPPVAALPEGNVQSGRIAASVHGGLYAGMLGATIGAFFSSDDPASGAVPMGIATGIAGGVVVPLVVDRLGWSEAQVRTVGSATVWGGIIGGLFGDIANTDGTSAREVMVGGAIGSTIAGLGGYAMSREHKLTRGDVALVDTLAGIGAAGGLTIGMVMQPAKSEAYSLNSVIGIAGGAIVGYVAAPQTNTTQRRMLRVAALAAAGGAAPFLLYAGIRDPNSTADERVTGILSTAGLVAGAYLGFRLTRGMDEGLDTLDGKRHDHQDPDDAPVALVGRSSAGRWGLGGLGLAPLSPALAPQRGMALQLVGAKF